MTALYTEKEILNQLDDCAREFNFPMLDNGYIYFADTRLSAFRDQTRWGLIIEVIGYSPRGGGHGGIQTCLYCFGNALKRPPGAMDEDFLFLTDDGPDGPTFDEEYDSDVLEGVSAIRIRDRVVPLEITEETLAREGIELVEPPQITGADLVRHLIIEHRELLVATEEELRDRIPPDLPLILRLNEWHHPDIAGDELPSQSEAFKLIAQVLVRGDSSSYLPTEEPNTHWKNWPESGTL